MNLSTKQKQDLQISKTNLWLPKGKHGQGRINQELGINTHTHTHTHTTVYETDNQEGPTYSTGNCTQYSVKT